MKQFLLLVSLFMFNETFSQPGILDSSFGSNGISLSKYGDWNISVYNDFDFQSSGKIVATGYSDTSRLVTVVGRYNVNGKLDKTFGERGFVQQGPNGQGRAICIRPDDKIVVLINASGSNLRLLQLQPDGQLDSSFGVNGVVITPLPSTASDMILQQDDKLIVCVNNEYRNSQLARFNKDGSLDIEFGKNGMATLTYGYNGSLEKVALTSSGKIVACGKISSGPSRFDLLVARFNSNGVSDDTFGNKGIVVTGDESEQEYGRSLAVLENDKIIVAGDYLRKLYVSNGVVVAKYNADGSLDHSFGDNGIIKNRLLPRPIINDIAVQRDGKILLTGKSTDHHTDENMVTLIRLHSDGRADSRFGSAGVAVISSRRSSMSNVVKIQNDGKIVIAGFFPKHLLPQFMLARYLSEEKKIAYPYITEIPVIYPNPVKDILHISRLSATKKTELSISDFSGNIKMRTLAASTNCAWNIAILKSGSYLLTVREEGKNPVSIRFIKEK